VGVEESAITVVEKIVTWVYRRAWRGRLLPDQMTGLQFEKFREKMEQETIEKWRTGFSSSEEFPESLVAVIIAFNRSPVAHEGVEHHGGVHQALISAGSLPQVRQSTCLRCRVQAFSHPYPPAVHAIRTIAVNRNISVSARNRDAVFRSVPLELQSFHAKKISPQKI
jgi:hypothetical protein